MNYYKEIKNELINNEITKKIKDYSKNRSDLTTYYNVGKLLGEVGNIIFSKSQSMIDLLTFTHYCAIIWFDDIVKSLEKT